MKTMSELSIERVNAGIRSIDVAEHPGISSGHYSKLNAWACSLLTRNDEVHLPKKYPLFGK